MSESQPPAAAPADGPVSRDRHWRQWRASHWLLTLSILFAIFGTGFGLYKAHRAAENREILASVPDDQVLTVAGESYTVRELKKQWDREVYLLFGLNYFLAVVMFGLYRWARRAPYPATITGLCVYLAVIALNAVIDPGTLAQGIPLKILFIIAMVAGIRAALEERDHGPASPAGSAVP